MRFRLKGSPRTGVVLELRDTYAEILYDDDQTQVFFVGFDKIEILD